MCEVPACLLPHGGAAPPGLLSSLRCTAPPSRAKRLKRCATQEMVNFLIAIVCARFSARRAAGEGGGEGGRSPTCMLHAHHSLESLGAALPPPPPPPPPPGRAACPPLPRSISSSNDSQMQACLRQCSGGLGNVRVRWSLTEFV